MNRSSRFRRRAGLAAAGQVCDRSNAAAASSCEQLARSVLVKDRGSFQALGRIVVIRDQNPPSR
jgi:hypothetical protein